MSYKKKTEYLGIPVVGIGERISPEVEFRKYTIIENMLIAGMLGFKNVIFDEGTFVLKNDGNSFLVKLVATGSSPSGEGIVGGFYFRAPSQLQWTNLRKGYRYFLYLRGTADTPHKNNSVNTVCSETPLAGLLLMAVADLRSEEAALNLMPQGKVYSEDVIGHPAQKKNPHGNKLEQEELILTKRLRIGPDAEIELGGSSISAVSFLETMAEVGGRRVQSLNFKSAGKDGIILKALGKVLFAQVQRLYSGKFDGAVGDIFVGYFGIDDKIDSDNEFSIYNAGDTGLPMKALVISI